MILNKKDITEKILERERDAREQKIQLKSDWQLHVVNNKREKNHILPTATNTHIVNTDHARRSKLTAQTTRRVQFCAVVHERLLIRMFC